MNASEFILYSANHPDDYYGILNAYDSIIEAMQDVPESYLKSTVRLRTLIRNILEKYHEFSSALFAAKKAGKSGGDDLDPAAANLLGNRGYTEHEKDLLSFVLDEALSRKFAFPPTQARRAQRATHDNYCAKITHTPVQAMPEPPTTNITYQQFMRQMASLGYRAPEARAMWHARTCESYEIKGPSDESTAIRKRAVKAKEPAHTIVFNQTPKVPESKVPSVPPSPTPEEESDEESEEEAVVNA